MGPDPLTVFIAPRMKPTPIAMAIGRSMCTDLVRRALIAPTKNTLPGQAIGRDDQRQRQPPEELLVLRLHAVQEAAVQRDRGEHDVHCDRAGDADADERRTVLGAPDLLALQATIRVRGVAERVERARDLRQRHCLSDPTRWSPETARTWSSARATPGSNNGTRSTSQTQEAQCTPSR